MYKQPLTCAAAFMTALLGPTLLATAGSPDANLYYNLSTVFRGPDQVLDVFNGGAKNDLAYLGRRQNVSGQFWTFAPVGDGTYRMKTQFRGAAKCLDIFNGGPNDNQPHFADCANVSGQLWMIVDDGQSVRLKTVFRGTGMCLDIFNGGVDDGQPYLAPCANFSGQLWRLSPTGQQVNASVAPAIVSAPPVSQSLFPLAAQSWGGAVRSGPGAGSSQLASLNEREPITILEQSDAPFYQDRPWFKISYRGRVGYHWGGIICPVGVSVPGTFQVC